MPVTATWRSPLGFPEAEAITEPTPALLGRVTGADPGRVLLIDGPVELTGAALRSAVAADQARLRAAGVQRGHVVCAQLPNWWEAVSLAHAVWGLGATLCPVPVNYRVAEVSAILAAAPVTAFAVPGEYRGTVYQPIVAEAMQRSGRQAPLLTVRPSGVPSGPGTPQPGPAGSPPPVPGDAAAEPELAGDLDTVCLLMFTSGTTGRPKGVLHSHRTLLADAQSIADLYRMRADVVYMPSPVGHVTGLVYGVLMPLLMGGSCVLQAEWDAGAGADLIERHGGTVCVGATPFLRGLTDEYRRRGQRSALRAFICGGADVPPSLVREAEAALGATVARAYGLTEMPTVTCGGPGDPEAIRADTDGRLTGSSQARLATPAGGSGELEVRGPELCLGYLDPADTAASFTADGWFRTGDLARLGADQDVTIVGRAKDIVVRGGENISMKEVEDYLAAHPHIADVAIVGVPDDVLGERACAFVVARGGAPTLAELASYLSAQGIARHKLPEFLLVVQALPRTLSGKIQKFRLRQQAAELLMAGHGERR